MQKLLCIMHVMLFSSVKSLLPWQKGPGHFCGGIGGTQGTQDANLSRRQDEANVKSDQRTKSL